MMRFVVLGGYTTINDQLVYSVRNDGEHIGYFIGGPKYAQAIETAVMIVQRTPLALGETK